MNKYTCPNCLVEQEAIIVKDGLYSTHYEDWRQAFNAYVDSYFKDFGCRADMERYGIENPMPLVNYFKCSICNRKHYFNKEEE